VGIPSPLSLEVKLAGPRTSNILRNGLPNDTQYAIR
jgi:hypothetical protein